MAKAPPVCPPELISSDNIEPDSQRIRIVESCKVSERAGQHLLRGVFRIFSAMADSQAEGIHCSPKQPEGLFERFRGVEHYQSSCLNHFLMHIEPLESIIITDTKGFWRTQGGQRRRDDEG